MTRLVASAVLATVTSVLWPGVAGIHAQAEDFEAALVPQVPYAIADAAVRHGLDPWALHGALISTRLSLEQYLALEHAPARAPEAPAPAARAPERSTVVNVRLTYYTLQGRTASGQMVHPGGTACSSNWAMGTRFRLPHGEVFVCNDRGILGNRGWLDVWNRPDLARRYGSYVDVEVLN